MGALARDDGKVKVRIVSLGYLKSTINIKHILQWKSNIFYITKYDHFELLPNTEGPAWQYTDEQLRDIIVKDNSSDITIAVISAGLEKNWHFRTVMSKIVVVSLFEVDNILRSSEIPLENYILLALYRFSTVYKKLQRLPEISTRITHDETRGCLFDFHAYKTDLIYSTEKVILCEECKTNLKKARISSQFIHYLEKELKQIRQKLYYRIASFIKIHPILAIVISLTIAFLVNITSSIFYDIFLSHYFK